MGRMGHMGHMGHINQHGSYFRIRKERGAVASALVLHHDAQDVRQGSDAGENADACAGDRLGIDRHGSRPGPQASRLSVLSNWERSAPRRELAARFESISILPWAEKQD